MALMFPDSRKTRVIFPSVAEEQFYNICLEQLPDSWRVYYSCTLSALEDGKGLVDNEIDFVLYHQELGAIVVEVKGGQIGFDPNSGEFHSVNRYGEKFNIKNPFQQALTWKSRFLRFLKKMDLKVPVTQAVCFPGAFEGDFPPTAGVEPALIIGKERIQDLKSSLIELVKSCQPERFLKFRDVGEQIDHVLKGAHFLTRLHIRDYIDAHESKLKDIETIHETFITPIASAQRLAIEGAAGSGKTMLAVMLARYFRDKGHRVLLLSSNHLLTNHLKLDLGGKVEVMTYAEIASKFGVEILRRPADFEGSREDWTQFVGPERLKEAILKSPERFDVLLCDEAQDVQPFWWEALEGVLQKKG